MNATCLGGRYKIIGQLGAGGFSQTFLVQDLHLPNNPRCVVKQLKPQTEEPKSLEMARRLFDTEARVLYQLGKHAQIPTLLAHFEENREFYLTQEYVEGLQLSWELSKRSPLSETRTIRLLQEILDILVFVHQEGVIHRDIKPSNLIRRYRDGKIVLIDFGAVKEVSKQAVHLDAELTSLTVAVGTQGYMPNEQMAGRPRFSSDVYAVGMIGIRALTGIHPKHFTDDFQTGELNWHHHIASASPELIDVIDCMVKYDFRDRYPSAMEALEALRELPIDPDEAFTSHADLLFPYPMPQDLPTFMTDPMALPLPDGYPPPLTVHEFTTSIVETSQSHNRGGANNQGSNGWSENGGYSLLYADRELSHQWLLRCLLKKPWVALLSIGVGMGFLVFVSAVLVLVRSNMFGIFYEDYIVHWLNIHSTPNRLSVGLKEVSVAARKILPAEILAEDALAEGQRLQQSETYSEAMAMYQKAIRFQPNLAEAYLGQCEVLNELEQPSLAIVACNDALAYRPDYPEAMRSKGNALEQQGRLLEALRLYERASLFKPDLFTAWLDQGRILQKVGRSAEATQALERAIALNRNSAEAWSLLGAALWQLERYNQSIEALDKALQIEPEYSEAQRLRQRAKDILGR